MKGSRMTTLYKPIPIPKGGIIPDRTPGSYVYSEFYGVARWDGHKWCAASPGIPAINFNTVGWVLLVPIEVEKEQDCWPDFSQSPPEQIVMSRLVTPWEAA